MAVRCSINLTLDQIRVCFQCILGLVLCSAGAKGHMWAFEWGKGLPRLREYSLFFVSLASSSFGQKATFSPLTRQQTVAERPRELIFGWKKVGFGSILDYQMTARLHTQEEQRARERAHGLCEWVCECALPSLSLCSPLPAKHPRQPWLKIQNKVRAPRSGAREMKFLLAASSRFETAARALLVGEMLLSVGLYFNEYQGQLVHPLQKMEGGPVASPWTTWAIRRCIPALATFFSLANQYRLFVSIFARLCFQGFVNSGYGVNGITHVSNDFLYFL